MAQLYLNGQDINTVFDRGDKENDITFSLGWTLAQSDVFLEYFLKDIFLKQNTGKATSVHLQKHGKDKGGFTDIEIETEKAHVIVEAKRGWNLPEIPQLKKYAPRFRKKRINAIVVMSQCEPTQALSKLRKRVNSIPVQYRSWKQVTTIATQSVRKGNHREKRLLREFVAYMEGLMDMQNVNKSNMVYVIPLGNEWQPWAGKYWWEYVTENKLFFQPTSKKWVKESPNYLGFRLDGKIKSIHHIESSEDVDDLYGHIPGVLHSQNWMHKPHRLWWLGKPIIPDHDVKSTGLQSGSLLAALDLLLTCKTVLEACKKTKLRLKE